MFRRFNSSDIKIAAFFVADCIAAKIGREVFRLIVVTIDSTAFKLLGNFVIKICLIYLKYDAMFLHT